MNIRKAVIDDYNDIISLYMQSDFYHYINEPYIYLQVETNFRSKEYIQQIIDNNDSLFLVAELEDKIIGFIYAYRETKGSLPIHVRRTYLYIDNIVVKNNEQHKGCGKALLTEVIKIAKEQKYNDIVLNVYSFNKTAIELYQKFGFSTLSEDMILKL